MIQTVCFNQIHLICIWKFKKQERLCRYSFYSVYKIKCRRRIYGFLFWNFINRVKNKYFSTIAWNLVAVYLIISSGCSENYSKLFPHRYLLPGKIELAGAILKTESNSPKSFIIIRVAPPTTHQPHSGEQFSRFEL